MTGIYEPNRIVVSTGRITPVATPQVDKSGVKQNVKPFDELLKQQVQTQKVLNFSKHAAQRISERGVQLSEGHMERLKNALQLAEKKGVDDTLVLMDQMAFIVNVPNSTVITAITQESLMENVFSNIDGAVIV